MSRDVEPAGPDRSSSVSPSSPRVVHLSLPPAPGGTRRQGGPYFAWFRTVSPVASSSSVKQNQRTRSSGGALVFSSVASSSSDRARFQIRISENAPWKGSAPGAHEKAMLWQTARK